ncbi:FAD-dependent oxidoreductase, partial [Diaphorobacter sp.]
MSQPLDVIILGAGSAGLAALREVRKRTDQWRIVNDGPWGTTCARVGCMPSKMLIEAANAYHARRALHTFGIEGADALRVDLP